MKGLICPICKKELEDTFRNWNTRDNFIWVECPEHGEVAMDIDKYIEHTGFKWPDE